MICFQIFLLFGGSFAEGLHHVVDACQTKSDFPSSLCWAYSLPSPGHLSAIDSWKAKEVSRPKNDQILITATIWSDALQQLSVFLFYTFVCICKQI
jgi:hypothetical protein